MLSIKIVLIIQDKELFDWIRGLNHQNKIKTVDGIRGLQIAIYQNTSDGRYPIGLLALWVVHRPYFRVRYDYTATHVIEMDSDNHSPLAFYLMQFLKNPSNFDELVENLDLEPWIKRNNSMRMLSINT